MSQKKRSEMNEAELAEARARARDAYHAKKAAETPEERDADRARRREIYAAAPVRRADMDPGELARVREADRIRSRGRKKRRVADMTPEQRDRRNAAQKALRLANLEKIREADRLRSQERYYADHEETLRRHRAYKASESSKAARRRYGRANREKIRDRRAANETAGRWKKRNADPRGLSFTLTEAQFDSLYRGSCEYCGESPCLSIDRLDNKAGYEIENCTSCCRGCNMLRARHSQKDFLDRVMKIAAHQAQRSLRATG